MSAPNEQFATPAAPAESRPAAKKPSLPFELLSLPDPKKGDRWFLVQRPLRVKLWDEVTIPTTVGHVEGSILEMLQPHIGRLLRKDGDASSVAQQLTGQESVFPLSEDQALRLGLVLNIASNRFSTDKVGSLVQKACSMEQSELVFWVSKVAGDGDEAEVYRKGFLSILP